MRDWRTRRERRAWRIKRAARANREIASNWEGAGTKEEDAQERSDFPGDQNDEHLWTWLRVGTSASSLAATVKQLDKGKSLHYKPLQGITG